MANKGREAKKVDLARWVSWGLKKVLTHNNITKIFMISGIWPLNPLAMDGNM